MQRGDGVLGDPRLALELGAELLGDLLVGEAVRRGARPLARAPRAAGPGGAPRRQRPDSSSRR